MTALINQCLTVILEYIDLFKYLLAGYNQLLVGPTPLKRRHYTILEVYLHDHARQFSGIIDNIYNLLDSAHYPFPLTKQTSKSLPKIVYGQVHVGFTIDNTVSMVTYPIRRNKVLKVHDKRSQK